MTTRMTLRGSEYTTTYKKSVTPTRAAPDVEPVGTILRWRVCSPPRMVQDLPEHQLKLEREEVPNINPRGVTFDEAVFCPRSRFYAWRFPEPGSVARSEPTGVSRRQRTDHGGRLKLGPAKI